jgi:hypothetical protein
MPWHLLLEQIFSHAPRPLLTTMSSERSPSSLEKGRQFRRGRSSSSTSSAAHEDAVAAKLWAIYVSEAEKYDRGLVESWKSDMEGILIFVCTDIVRMYI